MVVKKLYFAHRQDSTAQHIADWKKELALFAEADLNKPILKGAYHMQTFQKGDTLITAYLATTAIDGVEKMEIWKEKENLLRISVIAKKSNFLYEHQKNLELLLEEGRLKSYRIESTQTVMGLGTDGYGIVGYIQK